MSGLQYLIDSSAIKGTCSPVFSKRGRGTVANAELIKDFSHAQKDKSDPRAMNAMSGGGMDDACGFIGKKGSSGTAGERRSTPGWTDLRRRSPEPRNGR